MKVVSPTPLLSAFVETTDVEVSLILLPARFKALFEPKKLLLPVAAKFIDRPYSLEAPEANSESIEVLNDKPLPVPRM
ncbi:hypothetical protein ACI3PL_15930, partial [Lacticaseibacillus paracasei]